MFSIAIVRGIWIKANADRSDLYFSHREHTFEEDLSLPFNFKIHRCCINRLVANLSGVKKPNGAS